MAKNASIQSSSMPMGLLGYPILQSADILMARAHVVPVGKDNLAHIEITRYIARKCNNMYGHIFDEPEPILTQCPSLIGIDGKGKMSKSANNAIFSFFSIATNNLLAPLFMSKKFFGSGIRSLTLGFTYLS